MSQCVCVFDADGVLYTAWQFAEYLEKNHGLTRARTRSFFEGDFVQCVLGRADLYHCLPTVLKDWGIGMGVNEFVEIWFKLDGVLDSRVMSAIERLRMAGVRCFLATTQERHRFAYMRRTDRLEDRFDGVFVSCELRVKKPDPEFYIAVEEKLGVTGTQINFWDDTLANVQAAEKQGWRAMQYKNYEGFEIEFQRILQNDFNADR